MRCEDSFYEIYGHAPQDVAFCPYRISPLGAHIDHQYGKINGFAIDRGVYVAYEADESGIVQVRSLDFPGQSVQFRVDQVEEVKVSDWADHLRGAATVLGEKHALHVGMRAVIEGTLPIGGISSSAAVIISFMTALCRLNQIQLTQMELILLAQKAENQYVGVSCGKLDQSCEVLSRKDHLLYLDTKTDEYELIPANPSMKPYQFAIIFSGLTRSLKNSGYNLRVDECKSASYALKYFSGSDYGMYADTRLRDVDRSVYEQYKDRLPGVWQKRAEHFYTELARAEEGAEAWRSGDLERYGQLVYESGYSSIHNYECGCPELIRLYEILTETDGVYGGRFSGAGFKGCCMALIDPTKAEQISHYIKKEYLKSFPNLEPHYSFHLCSSADGVK